MVSAQNWRIGWCGKTPTCLVSEVLNVEETAVFFCRWVIKPQVYRSLASSIQIHGVTVLRQIRCERDGTTLEMESRSYEMCSQLEIHLKLVNRSKLLGRDKEILSCFLGGSVFGSSEKRKRKTLGTPHNLSEGEPGFPMELFRGGGQGLGI